MKLRGAVSRRNPSNVSAPVSLKVKREDAEEPNVDLAFELEGETEGRSEQATLPDEWAFDADFGDDDF